MTRLRLCSACSRHVFVGEAHCPFCKSKLAAAPNSPVFKLQAGLSRAQRLAIAAAVIGQSTIGCSDTHERDGGGTPSPTAGAASGTAGDGSGTAGTAGKGDAGRAGSAATSGSGTGGLGMQVPVYGAPPISGSGGSGAGGGTAGSDEDAGTTDPFPPSQPVYGAPTPR